MAFSLPRNVPTFQNGAGGYGIPPAQSQSQWSSSGSVHGRRPSNGPISRFNDFFGSQELPMYKDKPFTYASSRKQRPLWRRKRILGLSAIFLFGASIYLLGLTIRVKEQVQAFSHKVGTPWKWIPSMEGKVNDWEGRRERVREAFMLSWDAYEQYAWGYDEFYPLSRKGRQMVPKGMGWIIVDSLDTLMIMNLTKPLSHARQWISTSLDWDKNHDVNTFETTIRMLGGLLSAHYLSTEFPKMAPISLRAGSEGEDLYLEKAVDLAQRLIGAFDSPSGIPYASVNLKTEKGIESHADGGSSSTAEATSLQLEMKYLAKLTGEVNYWEKAEKVIQVVDDNGAKDGLLPIYLHPRDGYFRGSEIRLGSRGDSYYEYLLKQYLQTSKKENVYREMYDDALKGIRKHLVSYSHPSHLTFVGELQNGINGELTPKMDHLVCFLPGTIALGVTNGLTEAAARKLPTWNKQKEEELFLAKELMKTCYGMYNVTKTGLAPEITYFKTKSPTEHEKDFKPDPKLVTDTTGDWSQDYDIHPNDVHNLQRPETVESLFILWRITGDVTYRHWGWTIFKAFMEHTAVEDTGGFTSLNSVLEIPTSKRDNMESFWLAETLKYLYLLFGPDDILPLNKIVFNTEAHPFPVFEMGELFKTGWKRKPRDANGNMVEPIVDANPGGDVNQGVKTVHIKEKEKVKAETEAAPAAAVAAGGSGKTKE